MGVELKSQNSALLWKTVVEHNINIFDYYWEFLVRLHFFLGIDVTKYKIDRAHRETSSGSKMLSP